MAAIGGIERIVALAALDADWRAKVLADPAAAAREADIELSETERSLLRSVSRSVLEHMIDNFRGSASRSSRLVKLAAGIAAAALLAATPVGCSGIRSDVPIGQERPTQPTPPGGGSK